MRVGAASDGFQQPASSRCCSSAGPSSRLTRSSANRCARMSSHFFQPAGPTARTSAVGARGRQRVSRTRAFLDTDQGDASPGEDRASSSLGDRDGWRDDRRVCTRRNRQIALTPPESAVAAGLDARFDHRQGCTNANAARLDRSARRGLWRRRENSCAEGPERGCTGSPGRESGPGSRGGHRGAHHAASNRRGACLGLPEERSPVRDARVRPHRSCG